MLLTLQLLAASGQSLLAGDHILSGSFTTKAPALRPGQLAEATLGDFGPVRCTAS